MTLPEVCPLDENQTCKGRECHLFCLEWRTREPTCIIGYNATSKVRSGRDDRNKDTYAEDTFRKLGRQPLPRMNISGKGDWTPTRPVERPPEGHLERKGAKPSQEKDARKCFFGRQEAIVDEKMEKDSEEDSEKRLQGRQVSSEAEKASLRLEARLKKDPAEEESKIIYAKLQPKAQEKPKVQEKIISRDKHSTIFSSCDEEEKKNIYLSSREEKPGKTAENRDKRKKLDEVMDIDLPDNYEEEFWS
ncbi:TPA: hypothetical protein HA338_07330 [Methanosarcina acetivorans]|uniref:Uncharacterized protein n=2 Tax=Methanosarcina acetivorans TaxID=2214 RepID=Q8TRK9_METAC|nr:hypothetical protein [Methanosarcina acetivorans]AAM04587.1 predicted protein [Methanosarcina acetivorans C2A]HIH93849.1 hypothetical protein [Methanosarcina acetivorans]